MLRPDLNPGPATDLAITELAGGIVTDHGDHLVVRSPHNPDFHWGNYVLVTTGDPDDVQRWLDVFAAQFPDARHVAIGVPRAPASVEGMDLEVDVDDALTCTGMPTERPLPEGFVARELAGDDWEQVVAAEMAQNERTGRYDPDVHERYIRGQVAARRELAARGLLAWFGAFDGPTLVADLGIVVLGDTARYQAVGTAEAYRRRGLAGHLLGRAARWAHERGAERFVIVTGATNPAGRLYRSVGFEPAAGGVELYRPPAR